MRPTFSSLPLSVGLSLTALLLTGCPEADPQQTSSCGDGIIDDGEACDDGNTDDGDGCSATCAEEVRCGNDVLDEGEECDDGNLVDDDGCSATCTEEELCGNGQLDGDETCDDGNMDPDDGCDAFCQEECGNGQLDGDEVCDDGNVTSGDGCDADCLVGAIDFPTFRAASYVIGQDDFSTIAANQGQDGPVPNSLGLPIGAPVVANGRLYALDSGNARILIFNDLPTTSGEDADDLIGRDSLTGGERPGVNGGSIKSFARNLCTDGTSIAVSDANDYSLQIWGSAPATDAPSSVRLPAVDPVSADGILRAWGCAMGGGKFVAMDRNAHRVLLYNSVPTTDTQAPDLVLGQPDFTSGEQNSGGDAGASTILYPEVGWTDGTRLAVVDTGNNRVLLWNTWPTTNGQAADVVLGQPDFTSADAAAGAAGLDEPIGVTSNGEMLIIGDSGNHRVVVHNVWPTTSGRAADRVLGQSDFDHVTAYDDDQDATEDAAPTARTLGEPGGVFLHGSTLFVSETQSHRIVVFD